MADKLSRRQALLGVSGLAVLGAAPLLCAAAAPALRKVTLTNGAGTLNTTLATLMRQQKFFESMGLDAEELDVGDGSKMVGAVLGGSVDATIMSGFGQIFPAIERGAGLKVLGGGALLPTVSLFTGKADVHTLKDLEGRTIGTGSIGALLHQLVVALLDKNQVDVTKIRFVNVGSSADVLRAVSAGTVDAGPAATAVIPQAAQYKLRLIPGGNMTLELPQFTFSGAWASDRKIATSRDLLVRALAAQAKLYRFVQTPAAKGPFIDARRSAFPSAAAADHEAEWDYIATYKPLAVNLVLEPARLEYIQQLNVKFDVQKKVLPFSQVADMSLAEDAIKLLGGPLHA